jgi:hypothetical protein
MIFGGEDKINPAGGKGLDASGKMLIAANLIPLVGVLAWDWSIFNVVMLYWFENVIIGGINVLKMITCNPDPKQVDLKGKLRERLLKNRDELSDEEARKAFEFAHKAEANMGKLGIIHHASKLFFIPFFTFHYGFFCLGHGFFVFALLGRGEGGASLMKGGSLIGEFSELLSRAIELGGTWAVLALVVSHLFSFFSNYLGKGEYRRTVVPALMIAPYGRIVVLHLAIIFGAFATMALGSPVYLLVILIIGKIILDWKFHQRAHRKLLANQQPSD